MNFSEFQTVMYGEAQIVKQRPIGSHSTHPDDKMGVTRCFEELLQKSHKAVQARS